MPSARRAPGAGAPPGRSAAPWWGLATAAARAGAGLLWFTGGPEVPAPDEASVACDACTIAASALAVVDGLVHGVVSVLPWDRHPAVLARDVTTLDVLSSGRAALLLRWEDPVGTGTGGGDDRGRAGAGAERCAAWRYLAEACAVCRAVFEEDAPSFAGRYLHVAGAVNRPKPVRPGGPPVLVQVPSASVAQVRSGAEGSALREVLRVAAAVVCGDDPRDVATLREVLEDARHAPDAGRREDGRPMLVCRTGGLRPRRLEAARDAGAEGVIVSLGPQTDDAGRAAQVAAGDISEAEDRLSRCFEPWRR